MKIAMLALAAFAATTGFALRSAEDERHVQITDSGFLPDRIEVKVGDKIVWTNLGLKEHSVTANVKPALPEPSSQEKPLFDSGAIKPGGTFEYTFTKEGTYEYACKMQKGMAGTVSVKASR